MSLTENKLAADTHIGRLELRVRDLGVMLDYYTAGIGLEPMADGPGSATLGLGGAEILRLTEAPDLRPARSGDAGLFHAAVLFDSPGSLARSMDSMLTQHPDTFTGAGDHLVSEAFYFTDPEGNGVELYRDRPRESWQWDGGHVRMATLWIDPVRYIEDHLDDAMAPTAALGHVHLQVGDVATAHDFYVDALGFDETARLGQSALFVAAGGYHHHMAMNVWNSAGAGPRLNTLGLGVVDIRVGSTEEVERVQQRLAARGIATDHDGATLTVLDPWRNTLRISSR